MRPKPRPLVVRPVRNFTLDSVRNLQERRHRDETGLFVAEGVRFLAQAMEHSVAFAGLIICPYRLINPAAREWVTIIERAGVPLLKVSAAEYVRLSPGTSVAGENAAAAQGVLAVLRQNWEPLPDRIEPNDCWIGVESIRTSGNFGTLLRSGDATGATGMIVFDRSEAGSPSGVDPFDPAAVRASMGSIFSHRFIRTTHRAFRRWSCRREVMVAGGTPETETDYRSPDYRRPVVLMLGDEREGLSAGQRKTCDTLVRIPMIGTPDSLNLAMAGTLMLYEVLNQRQPVAS